MTVADTVSMALPDPETFSGVIIADELAKAFTEKETRFENPFNPDTVTVVLAEV
jgi:hypothetical protein